ncbi:hypothetical protein [Streptomyces sp. NRRL S-118]|uniref:hypothetical protein n=1 Tax=Streptomyces sp. NRRL S-118 TaxID=1463881 RepID=UPI0004C9AE22|nr:hypothetical protein [Streptomyces sp. NRRL S-118]
MGEAQWLSARVRRDFPAPDASVVIQLLEEWADTWSDWEVDRVQTAIVLGAAGDVDELLALLELAYQDYRDVLMATGFADDDWQERMEAALRSG